MSIALIFDLDELIYGYTINLNYKIIFTQIFKKNETWTPHFSFTELQ